MSVAVKAPSGPRYVFDAYVVAITPSADGRRLGFALGDGTVRLVDPARPEEVALVRAHDGACLALVPDAIAGGLLVGGDDGVVQRIAGDGTAAPLGRWPGAWIEAVASHARGQVTAVGLSRRVLLLDRAGGTVQALEHPSTAAGLAFDLSGQRLAVAHHGGIALWIAYREGWRSTVLPWAGSHLQVTWSPSGKFIVTAMQEGAVQAWRLADKKTMAMRGYPAKVRSLSWAARGRWLATSGVTRPVLWPFRTEDGPLGKEPHLLREGMAVVTTVAGHPTQPLLAVGRKDGVVELVRIDDDGTLPLRSADDDPVSALAWTPDGGGLAFGTEGGSAALLDLRR